MICCDVTGDDNVPANDWFAVTAKVKYATITRYNGQ